MKNLPYAADFIGLAAKKKKKRKKKFFLPHNEETTAGDKSDLAKASSVFMSREMM